MKRAFLIHIKSHYLVLNFKEKFKEFFLQFSINQRKIKKVNGIALNQPTDAQEFSLISSRYPIFLQQLSLLGNSFCRELDGGVFSIDHARIE